MTSATVRESTSPAHSAPFRFMAPIPRLTPDLAQWTGQLRRIEDLGYHSVYGSEHFSDGWVTEALTGMAFAAAHTRRVQVFALMLNNDLHHPAVLAKAIATANVLCGGRMGIGIGAGWNHSDYLPLGIEFDSAGVRIARLEESLAVIRSFFAGGEVNFHGAHYDISGLEALPALASPPPIVMGGGGEKMLTVAARNADIVSIHPRMRSGGFGPEAAQDLTRDGIRRKIKFVETVAHEAGRPRPAIQFLCFDINIDGRQVTGFRPGFSDYVEAHRDEFADSPGLLRGSVAKCVEDLRRWREELGISYWSLGPNIDALAPIVSQLSAE
jgi:probable F420-dependent oxidoreductase